MRIQPRPERDHRAQARWHCALGRVAVGLSLLATTVTGTGCQSTPDGADASVGDRPLTISDATSQWRTAVLMRDFVVSPDEVPAPSATSPLSGNEPWIPEGSPSTTDSIFAVRYRHNGGAYPFAIVRVYQPTPITRTLYDEGIARVQEIHDAYGTSQSLGTVSIGGMSFRRYIDPGMTVVTHYLFARPPWIIDAMLTVDPDDSRVEAFMSDLGRHFEVGR